MAKSSATTILLCATLAVLLLFLLASLPSRTPDRHHHHRRLKLRHNTSSSAHSHRQIPFDPVISDSELRREDRQWERDHFPLPHHYDPEPEWEDLFDPADYADDNDDDRFNITRRIVLLFPRIDVAPADGFVSLAELAEWNFQQAAQQAIHRSARELELHDSNRDGFISFEENQQYVKSSPADDMGWWKEDHFNASDFDGNGLLNLTEFNDFLHPADSSNPKLIQWLCKEEIRQKDRDEDGKLNFEEFTLGLFYSIQDNEAYNHSDTSELANKLFLGLDLDSDGFLSWDELVTVIGKVHHSDHYYAKQQADYALSEADSDKDGLLSLEEMIEHPYVFYSSIFSDDEDEDEDDDDDYHDEFR